jgi:hypothetical protein
MKNIILFTALIYCSISCSSGSKNVLDYKQNVQPVKGEKLLVDCFTGQPYSMTCLDNLLIFYDRYEGKTISVIDLKKNQYMGHFVPEGGGPDEVNCPVDILCFPQEDKLYVSQRNLGCLNTFSIPEMKMLQNIPFQERPGHIQKMKDYYVGEGYFEKGRFGIYDQQGNLRRVDGTYPFGGKDMDIYSSFLLYQASYCANPHANYFATGCIYCDHLVFYEVKENETVLLKEYQSYDVKGHNDKFQDETQRVTRLVINDDCILSYTWAYGTDSYCYMLYSGKTLAENDQRHGWGSHIIVFDWKGNYIKTLEPDQDIQSFCVDKTNRMIYAIVLDDEGDYDIMQFKI